MLGLQIKATATASKPQATKCQPSRRTWQVTTSAPIRYSSASWVLAANIALSNPVLSHRRGLRPCPARLSF